MWFFTISRKINGNVAMGINYNYYNVFYYVAKYKSFTKAAKVLQGNQSNISRYMTSLEEQLGCKLLNRSNHGITLTPQGTMLYSHINVIHQHVQAAEHELVNTGKDASQSSVVIGLSEMTLHGFLVDIISKYRELYPDVKIRLVNETYVKALDDLKEGLMDISLVTTRPDRDFGKDFVTTPFRRFRSTAFCGPKFRDMCKDIHTLREVSKLPLIGLSDGTLSHEFYSDIFAEYGLEYNLDTVTQTDGQTIPLIKGNMGIGFLPETITRFYDFSDFSKIEITDPMPDRYIVAIESVNKVRTPMVEALKNLLLVNMTP